MKLKDVKIGKLNIIDLMVISIIVMFIGIFAIGKIVTSGNADDNVINTANANFSYTILVEGLSETSKEMFKVGDELYERESNVGIGKITNLEITEAKRIFEKQNGEIIEVKVPSKIDVKMDIEASGMIKNDEYLANNLIRIMVGSTKQVKTKYVMCTGTIIDIVK